MVSLPSWPFHLRRTKRDTFRSNIINTFNPTLYNFSEDLNVHSCTFLEVVDELLNVSFFVCLFSSSISTFTSLTVSFFLVCFIASVFL